MNAELGKWGNSLALRIPAGLAKELGFTEGSKADLELADGRLVITPTHRKPRLKELLASLKQAGAEREISSGSEKGNEEVEW